VRLQFRLAVYDSAPDSTPNITILFRLLPALYTGFKIVRLPNTPAVRCTFIAGELHLVDRKKSFLIKPFLLRLEGLDLLMMVIKKRN
jgi:hypothetical protein